MSHKLPESPSSDAADPRELPPLEIGTRDEAEAAMGQFTALYLLLQREVVEQNAKLQLAAKHDHVILDLKARLKRYETALQEWARGNRKLFNGAKSLELRQGIIFFKLNPWSVVFLKDWTDKLVLARLQKLKGWAKYVRWTPAIDKRRILDDTDGQAPKLTPCELAKVGMAVEQEEKFTIEAKLEDVPIP